VYWYILVWGTSFLLFSYLPLEAGLFNLAGKSGRALWFVIPTGFPNYNWSIFHSENRIRWHQVLCCFFISGKGTTLSVWLLFSRLGLASACASNFRPFGSHIHLQSWICVRKNCDLGRWISMFAVRTAGQASLAVCLSACMGLQLENYEDKPMLLSIPQNRRKGKCPVLGIALRTRGCGRWGAARYGPSL